MRRTWALQGAKRRKGSIGAVARGPRRPRAVVPSSAALRRSEQRFRDFAESASDWFWETDERFRFVFFSDRRQAVTGLAPGGSLGRTRWEIAGADPDTDPQWARHRRVLEAHEPFRDFRYVFVDRDSGRRFHWSVNGVPVFEGGKFRGYRGTCSDVSAEVEAVTRAGAARELLSRAIEAMPEGLAVFDPDDRLVVCNRPYAASSPALAFDCAPGMTFEEIMRGAVRRNFFALDRTTAEEVVRWRMARHRAPRGPFEARLGNGQWMMFNEFRLADGGTVCIRTDITDRIRAEEALSESRELLQAVIDAVPAMINAKDTESRYILINRFQARLYGTTERDALGKTAADLVGEMHGARTAELDRRVLESGGPVTSFEATYEDAGGVEHTWLTTKAPLKDAGGRARGIVTAALEITDRRRAEQALRKSEQRFRDVAESAGDWIWEMGPDLRFTYLSPRFFELFPGTEQRILGKTRVEFAATSAGDVHWRRHLDDMAHRRSFRNFQYTVATPDGQHRHIRISGKPVFDADGRFDGYRGTGTDATTEVVAAESAKRAEAYLVHAIESMDAAVALYDADGRLILCNSRHRSLEPGIETFAPPGADFGEYVRSLALGARPEGDTSDDGFAGPRRPRTRPSGATSRDVRLADDRWFRIDAFPTEDGGTLVLRTDITRQRQLEQQLAEAQRMESIGQLTGGVAHDFNNLLSIILGNLKLLERRCDDRAEILKHVNLATGAATRGAELTRRLLAFSRHQVLEPEVIDVNRLISDLEPLLRRSLGETIRIETRLDPAPWPTRVDPSQFESALINLAINARDAMPDGGRLTVETMNTALDADYAAGHREVAPGDYVMIAVADTGTGIPPENLTRIFEPFFTTKEKGKGTGLGLSMVYGLIKQTGGHVKAYSELGIGTVIKIYLPKASTQPAERPAPIENAVPTGSETVLVVEDEPDVRETAAGLLAELGYRVVVAADGAEALDILARRRDIDLLFTDVVMPNGIGGPELARQARRLRPGLKVLLTSGYTESGVFANGFIDSGAQFVGKPLQLGELACKVRRALDSEYAPS